MAMSLRWQRRADERDQRHAHDRRAARAADHLHGGDADRCGRRSTSSCPIRTPAVAPANAQSDQIVLEVMPDGTYAINTRAGDEGRTSPTRLKEIYDPRPEKIIFVKGDPKVKYERRDLRDGRRARCGREGHRRSAEGHAGADCSRQAGISEAASVGRCGGRTLRVVRRILSFTSAMSPLAERQHDAARRGAIDRRTALRIGTADPRGREDGWCRGLVAAARAHHRPADHPRSSSRA